MEKSILAEPRARARIRGLGVGGERILLGHQLGACDDSLDDLRFQCRTRRGAGLRAFYRRLDNA